MSDGSPGDNNPLLRPGDVVRIAMTGAFLTGVSLEIEGLSVAEVAHEQGRLARILNERGAPMWKVQAFGDPASGLRYGGAPYETLLPSSFLHCSGALAQELLLRDIEQQPAHPERFHKATTWKLSELQVDLFPFAVGTVAATYEVTANADVSANVVRQIAEEVADDLVAPLNDFISSLVSDFNTGLLSSCPTLVSRPWIQGGDFESEPKKATRLSAGRATKKANPDERAPQRAIVEEAPSARLLWLHRVYVVEALGVEGLPDDTWAALRPFLHVERKFVGFTYLPGTDASVAIVPPSAPPGGASELEQGVLKVLLLQWAYFAAGSEIDRSLFRQLDRIGNSHQRPKELEADLRAVMAFYERVRLFRARLNSLLADLGGGAIALWDTGAEVQALPQLYGSVDDKVEALQTVCRSRLQELAVIREHRLNRTVALFTIFNVVSSIVAVAVFLVGPTKRPGLLRTLWVLVITTSAMLLIWISRREVKHRA